MICILVVPHVLVCSYNDMHTGSTTCMCIAIMICILVVPHVLVCSYNDMHTGSATCIIV